MSLLDTGPRKIGQKPAFQQKGNFSKNAGKWGGKYNKGKSDFDSPYPKTNLAKTGRTHRLVHSEPSPLTRFFSLRSKSVPADHYILDPKLPTLMLVAEAPGNDEDANGRTLIGRSGQLLRFLLKNCDLRKYNIYLTNICKFRPPGEGGSPGTPTEKMIASCLPTLEDEMKKIKPKVIVALGEIAAKTLIDFGPQAEHISIGAIRGKFFNGKYGNTLVTYHPARIVREPLYGTQLNFDICKASLNCSFDLSEYKKRGTTHHIKTLIELRAEVKRVLAESKLLAFDFETTCLSKCVGDNDAIALLWSDNIDSASGVLIDHPDSPWTEEEKVEVKELCRTLLKSSVPKLAHNAKYDIAIARITLGCRVNSLKFDTMLALYNLDENICLKKEHGAKLISSNLEDTTAYWLDFVDTEWLSIKENRGNLIKVEGDKVVSYGGGDVIFTYRIGKLLKALLQAKDPKSLGNPTKIHNRLTQALADIEVAGLPIDAKLLEDMFDPKCSYSLTKLLYNQYEELLADPLVKKYNSQLNKTKDKKSLFFVVDGEEELLFNPLKPRELAKFYYEFMRLSPPPDAEEGKTPTGKEFEDFHEKVEIVQKIKAYKQCNKMLQFVQIFKNHSEFNTDGKVHANYHINGTVTGRLSSSDPNLQQISRADNEIKAWIKRLIKVPPGYILITCDYQAAEVRVGALNSRDETLADVFRSIYKLKRAFRENPSLDLYKRIFVDGEGDIHKQNYSKVFGVPVNKVTKVQRTEAKGITFGVLFSETPEFQLAGSLNIPVEDAKKKVDAFLGPFDKLKEYLYGSSAMAGTVGFTHSLFGRRRTVYGGWSIMKAHRHAKNQLQNTGIQSTSSDITGMAAYKFIAYARSRKLDWHIINIVHDALYFMVPISEARTALPIIESTMLNPGLEEFGIDASFVPLEVDFDLGLNGTDSITWDYTEEHLDRIMEWIEKGAPRDTTKKMDKDPNIPRSKFALMLEKAA